MDYPVWYLPLVSKGFIMAVVAVLHVFVAQFAVGGGLYLVWMERRAQTSQTPDASAATLGWLQRHTFFFLLLTMVFGGLSGVGIWFTMTVVNPAASSALIHSFLWVWAAEWVFFLVEIVALLIYHYSYPKMLEGSLNPKTHLRVGCIYAFAGWMSLFFINGVICFMLTPGEALESGSLFEAFFNPSTLPSTLYRTALCMIIAGMFALFTASRIKDDAAKRDVIRQSSLWVCIPFVALLAASAWYFFALPPDRQDAMLRRTDDIHPFLLAYGWVLPLVFILGVLAFVRAERLRRPLTVLILCTGLVLAGSFEWMREAGRRPWVIPGYMYSSAVRPAEGEAAKKHGIASASGWLRIFDENYAGEPGYLAARGSIIFSQQCAPCHAVGGPRLNIVPRLAYLTPEGIYAQISGQGSATSYMPPFYGNPADRAALSIYLSAVSAKKLSPHAESSVFDPGCVMTALPQEGAIKVPSPAFNEKSKYVLVGQGLQGLYQSSPSGMIWQIDEQEKLVEAQLILRGPTPEVLSSGVKISWTLSEEANLDNGTVRFASKSGEMQADETNGFFSAIIEADVHISASEYFNPYQVLTLKAQDAASGLTLAESATVLAVSPGFGCAHCHADPGYGILALHDKRNGTEFQAEARSGSTVFCSSCHSGASFEDGEYQPGMMIGFSSAIHGWHAQYLTEREGDACLTCHIGLGSPKAADSAAPKAIFMRDMHNERGLSCVKCHGYMEDHAAALLRAEQEAGQELAARNLERVSPRAVEKIGDIKPRLPWIQEPDCTSCHDFDAKPSVAEASAFNAWTELPGNEDGLELFSRSMDYSGVMRCASCHGAPHAGYPASNPVAAGLDNIPPIQYQGAALVLGARGNCTLCHTIDMPMSIHHPIVESDDD